MDRLQVAVLGDNARQLLQGIVSSLVHDNVQTPVKVVPLQVGDQLRDAVNPGVNECQLPRRVTLERPDVVAVRDDGRVVVTGGLEGIAGVPRRRKGQIGDVRFVEDVDRHRHRAKEQPILQPCHVNTAALMNDGIGLRFWEQSWSHRSF